MNYFIKNKFLTFTLIMSLCFNIYLIYIVIDKSITSSYKAIETYDLLQIIDNQELLLNRCWHDFKKEEVVLILQKLIDEDRTNLLFMKKEHENSILFSNLGFYFIDGKLKKITSKNLDNEFNIID